MSGGGVRNRISRALAVATAALAASVTPSHAALAEATACTIPDGTHVRFHLTAPVSSNQSRTGQTFGFLLLAPIQTGTCTIPAQGATGSGTIYLAGASGSQGHEGDLTLRIDTLRTADGHFVNFDDQRIGINGKNRKIESSVLGFTPFVGLAAIFIRGSDAKIGATTPIETVLLHPASYTDAPLPLPLPSPSERPLPATPSPTPATQAPMSPAPAPTASS